MGDSALNNSFSPVAGKVRRCNFVIAAAGGEGEAAGGAEQMTLFLGRWRATDDDGVWRPRV